MLLQRACCSRCPRAVGVAPAHPRPPRSRRLSCRSSKDEQSAVEQRSEEQRLSSSAPAAGKSPLDEIAQQGADDTPATKAAQLVAEIVASPVFYLVAGEHGMAAR